MISFEQAQALVLDHTGVLESEKVPLEDGLGRFLAAPLMAPFNVPRFDNSSMDGYAVRLADVASASADSPVELRLAGQVFPGEVFEDQIPPQSAIKVLTGAPVPPTTEAVVMKEYVMEAKGKIFVSRSMRFGENIRHKGEEFQKGQEVLKPGVRITPAVLGLFASFGFTVVDVHKRPVVKLIITGDEIIPPRNELKGNQIYDSNSFSLIGACHAMGICDCTAIRVGDDLDSLTGELEKALESADVVTTVGGASVGDCDYVKSALYKLQADVHFSGVAMKPGKPCIFAMKSRKLIFGLPGNPVSALIAFFKFIKPALRKMSGAAEVLSPMTPAFLGEGWRKKAGRCEFVRGKLLVEEGRLMAYPTRGQDSYMLGGLAEADCLICLPPEKESFFRGESVVVEPIKWD